MGEEKEIFAVPTPFCIISSHSDHDNPNKLFLGGIPSEVTEKQLEEFFSQFGTVKDVRIVTDRVTAECKGYGFVTFDENEDVERLVERKSIRMNGVKLRIRKAVRRNGSQFEHFYSEPVKKQSTLVIPVPVNTSQPLTRHNSYPASPTLFYQPLTPPTSPTHATKVIPQTQVYLPTYPIQQPQTIQQFLPQNNPPIFYFQQPTTFYQQPLAPSWPLYQV